MPLRTGYCQSKDHGRCKFLIVNGSKASTLYHICACDCHYGDPETTRMLVEELKAWGAPEPEDNSYDALLRYVDTINVVAVPKYEEEDE